MFTSVYNLSLLYTTHIGLLYTCSNLLTVNVIALNTVPLVQVNKLADEVNKLAARLV